MNRSMPQPPPDPTTDTSPARAAAYLVEGGEVYGVAQMVLAEAGGLAARGWRIEIISLNPGRFVDECRSAGLNVTALGFGPSPRLTRGSLRDVRTLWTLQRYQRRAARQVARTLSELSIDVVNVAWPNLMGIAGRAAHARRVPCFWAMPNAVGSRWLGLNRWIYQHQCQEYGVVPLATSKYTASTLGDQPVKPIVRYLGVDQNRFNPVTTNSIQRHDIGIPDHAIVLSIIARIGPEKGQDRVLQAMLSLASTSPPLHLLLLGGPTDGPLANALRDTAQRAGAADRLHMPGVVTDPHRYYNAIDIAINCRIDPEPFGLSVIEAMMMRTPVLVHASGGPAETVIDGVTGWHVPAPTAEAFTAGLRRAITDQPRWDQMGAAAQAHANEHFTRDRMVDHYIQIVEQTLNAARTTPHD